MREPIVLCFVSTAAEASVVFTVCFFCQELGLTKVILKGDAEVIVKAVNTSDIKLSTYGHIVEEIKVLTHGQQAWRIKYVNQDRNKAGHTLVFIYCCSYLYGGKILLCISHIAMSEQLML